MNVWIIGAAAVIANAAACSAFRIDKARARSNAWRVSEGTLLSLALFGGWFGAKFAQRRFRHKTRKQPFSRHLNAIPFFWCVAAVVLVLLSHIPQEWIDAYTVDEPREVHRSLPQVRRF